MYILKNSWLNILRNKGRNILIGIIVIVIAAACSITLSIRNSADKIVDAYKNKYNIEATIGTNRDAMMEMFKESSSAEDRIDDFNNIDNLTIEEIENYGDSDYVSSYYYTYSLNMNADNIEKASDNLVKETTTVETETTQNNPPFKNSGSNGSTTSKKTTTKTEFINTTNGDFNIKGYNSYESMTDFIDGNYIIIEGEVSEDFSSNNCVISEELATLNDLEINDKITLVSPQNEDITYELVITGIYKEETGDASSTEKMFTNSANTIITNSKVVEDILSKDEELEATINPTYILNSEEAVDLFAKEVEEKGLSEYYTVTNNLNIIEESTKSIINVKTFATTFLLICLIIGCIVLLVINMINIRERRYEIGVLRTIGMKKSLVITQFMTELLIVSIFALLIGAGIGSLSSVKVANHLLENEITNSVEELNNVNDNFGRGNQSNEDKPSQQNPIQNIKGVTSMNQIDEINAIVDYKVIIQLLAIGIGLTIISSVSACIAIARFSPLTILKERS